MKIIVFNGSPKGGTSITMQSVYFIQKKYPQHELKIVDITLDISEIEKTEQLYQKIIAEIKASDGILWAFPLRVLLVPAQVKRFIELVFERKSEDAFKGKYAAAVSTSFHGGDHLAHNYLHAVCDDLGMNYVDFYSGELEDLLKKNEIKRLILFAENYFESIANREPVSNSFMPVISSTFKYLPSDAVRKINTSGRKVTIVMDTNDGQSNVGRMIERFKQSFVEPPEVIDLNAVEVKWCKGCLQCGYDNSCIQKDADGFYSFFESTIRPAEILLFAGAIKDRFLSSRWKLFFDRSFFNNHIPFLTNKQVGFIISGPLRQMPNLRQYLEMYAEWQQANLVDLITDEDEDGGAIDGLLQGLAERLVRFSEKQYVGTPTFLSIGLNKIIRDIVWGKMRFLAQANHRFFKKSGFYDFPQKDYKTRIINVVMMGLMRIPALRKKLYKSAMRLIIMPHQKLLAKQGKTEPGTIEP
ncbi:MAG TPA: NAD(P)H-dependent oxidoreductase [Candidatus Wunengus sp. YC65]|uniref:NAD(P)H-dependent oxidoreductase n=1 Tax=Candidatus Wunengus sp. YC65 TaxID=3367701 RepID=UPI0040282940